MKRIFLILFLSLTLLYSTKLNAQEILDEYTIPFRQVSTQSPFSVIDHEDSSHLFFITSTNIEHLKYNSENMFLQFKKHVRPPAPFKEIIGYSLDKKNVLHLYFSNNKKNRFFLKSIKPDGTTEQKEFDFKIKKEYFLQAINYQNTFYVLTVPQYSSVLNLYKFNGATFNVVNYDCSNETFYDFDNRKTELSKLLHNENVEIIEDDVPSAIEITSRVFKLYPKGNELLFTFDHRDSATRVIKLNLDDDSSSVDNHEIRTTDFKNLIHLKSNSFIYKDKIYQLIASKDLMVFTIKEMKTKKLIKEYRAEKDDEEIAFKNSALYQDGSLYSSGIRELNKTKQFLRKITNSRIGVVAYEKEDLLQLSMGGISEMSNGGAPMMMPGFGGIPIASAGVFTVSITPMFYTFNSYNNTRSVYIKCLFDTKTLEHMPGPVASNVFDHVAEFADSLDRVGLEVVFKKDDYFIYGYYDKKEKLYRLLRFEK
jgi:hypothetical protein